MASAEANEEETLATGPRLVALAAEANVVVALTAEAVEAETFVARESSPSMVAVALAVETKPTTAVMFATAVAFAWIGAARAPKGRSASMANWKTPILSVLVLALVFVLVLLWVSSQGVLSYVARLLALGRG